MRFGFDRWFESLRRCSWFLWDGKNTGMHK
jgi:hypothetical protein